MNQEEIELRREVARAEAARAYIEDPILVAAFEALHARYLVGWQETRSDDTAGREALWHRIKALAMVRAELESVLADGMLARERLDAMRTGVGTQP
jgi:hypothetical protein